MCVGLVLAVMVLSLVTSVLTRGQVDPPAPGPQEQLQTAPALDMQEPRLPAAPTRAQGLLENNTVFTVYGRAFDRAPILGRLGTYKNFDAMAEDLPKWVDQVKKLNDHKPVVPGVHLIYALAVPCQERGDCLQYLEGPASLIIDNYIKPAAERGWIVVLDTQLGRSNPVAQVNRMIEKGYLKYENVHVAIDPEFHVYPDKLTPGIPVGTVEAAQINEVQRILDDYVKSQGFKTKKMLIVHQFIDQAVSVGTRTMIENKKEIRTFENVELVIDADGLGTPSLKVWKYNRMTDAKTYPSIRFRGIKIFYPNTWEKAGHFDKPPMTMEQVFGIVPVSKLLQIATKPNLVIIA